MAASPAPPQTWDKLTETASKTTESPVYGIAFSAVNTEEATWQWEPFLWSNGGSLADLSSKDAQTALGLWVDWVKKGYASKGVANWNQQDVPNEFISGRAATMVMGPWQLANVKKSRIDFGIVTIPVPKEGGKISGWRGDQECTDGCRRAHKKAVLNVRPQAAKGYGPVLDRKVLRPKRHLAAEEFCRGHETTH